MPVDVGPATRRTAEVMGLAELFPIYSSSEAALAGRDERPRVRGGGTYRVHG
jgi:hypothetical protein